MIGYWFLMNFAASWCLEPEGLGDAADTINPCPFVLELKSKARQTSVLLFKDHRIDSWNS